MVLQLESREFFFESGQVSLIPSDWEEVAIATGQIPRPAPFEKGRVESASVERAGEFEVCLADLSLVRRSDNWAFYVPLFSVPEPVKISQADVLKGTATISVKLEGPYSVTLLRDGQPLAHQRVIVSVNTSTFHVRTDENGRILFLCMPTLYRLQLDPGVGMTIVQV
jgi:hypothetical protein